MPESNVIIGLDVGHHSVRVVRVERAGDGVSVKTAESMRLPLDDSDKTDVIKKWLSQVGGLSGSTFVVALCGQSIMFQPFALVPNDPRTFEQAVEMEVARFSELASETMAHGFQALSEEERERRMLVAMARPDAVDAVLGLAREMRFFVVDVVPVATALFNSGVVSGDIGEEPCIIADIGHQATEIAIGTKSSLMFARSFAGGGQLFTDAVERASGVGARQAETVKMDEGLLGGGPDEDTIAALTEAADMWVAEVETCLSVYRGSYPEDEEQPTKLVLSGGGAALQGLAQYAESKLDIKVVLSEGLPGEYGDVEPREFMIAAGLGISGLGLGAASISLLPENVRDDLLLMEQKRYWIAASAVAAAILIVGLAGGYYRVGRMKKELRAREKSLSLRDQIGYEIEQAKGNNKRAMAMSFAVEGLLQSGPIMRDLVMLLDEAKDKDDWITMIADADMYVRPAELIDSWSGQTAGEKRRSQRARQNRDPEDQYRIIFDRMVVEGYTLKSDLSTVQSLIAKLSHSDFIESADLMNDDKLIQDPKRDGKWAKTAARRFVIELKVVRP